VNVRFALLLLSLLAAAPAAAPQPAPSPSPRPSKSVRGTLQAVDARQNTVTMKDNNGQQLSWRFSHPVVVEVAKVAPGQSMIVIYRETAANEKRVTAVAFPGLTRTPIYENLTGARIVLRSAPAVAEACGSRDAQPVTESVIPAGGRAEVLDACWCCAPAGDTCLPATRSGQGRALLEQCFK
jgi:hypothetical protein